MKTLYFVYDIDFRKIHKSDNIYDGKELAESADRLLFNTVKSTAPESISRNNSNDVFRAKWMEANCKFVDND